MIQKRSRGCAARGDEVYVEHTARARKCAVSAHFILMMTRKMEAAFARASIWRPFVRAG